MKAQEEAHAVGQPLGRTAPRLFVLQGRAAARDELRADEQGLAETRRGLPGELLAGSPGEEPAAAQAHRRRGAVRAGSGSSCWRSGRSGCRREELAPGEGICSGARSATPSWGAGSAAVERSWEPAPPSGGAGSARSGVAGSATTRLPPGRRRRRSTPDANVFAGPFPGDEHPTGMPAPSLPFLLCETEQHSKPNLPSLPCLLCETEQHSKPNLSYLAICNRTTDMI
jgi:hypothetical protein